jgi:hypothetical protein
MMPGPQSVDCLHWVPWLFKLNVIKEFRPLLQPLTLKESLNSGAVKMYRSSLNTNSNKTGAWLGLVRKKVKKKGIEMAKNAGKPLGELIPV